MKTLVKGDLGRNIHGKASIVKSVSVSKDEVILMCGSRYSVRFANELASKFKN